jgi:hypothetical protein
VTLTVDQSASPREVNRGYRVLFSREGGSPDWIPAFAGNMFGADASGLYSIVIPAQAVIHILDRWRVYRMVSLYGFPPARE